MHEASGTPAPTQPSEGAAATRDGQTHFTLFRGYRRPFWQCELPDRLRRLLLIAVAIVLWGSLWLASHPGDRLWAGDALPLIWLGTFGLGVLAWHRPTWRMAAVGPDRIVFLSRTREVHVMGENVRVLAAEGGFDPQNEYMYVWKFTRLITDRTTYRLSLHPDMRAEAFSSMRKICVNAVHLPFNGAVILGSSLRNRAVTEGMVTTEGAWVRAWRRYSGALALEGLGFLVIGGGFGALALYWSGRSAAESRAATVMLYCIFAGVALCGAGLILLADATRQGSRRRRCTRLIQRSAEGSPGAGGVALEAALSDLAVFTPRPRDETGVRKLLLASLLLWWVPLVGAIVAFLAYSGTRARRWWLRCLSLASLVLALAVTTAVALFVMLELYIGF